QVFRTCFYKKICFILIIFPFLYFFHYLIIYINSIAKPQGKRRYTIKKRKGKKEGKGGLSKNFHYSWYI
ncbi:hypothetical protein ACJX0J_024814, partial [Zea mays]